MGRFGSYRAIVFDFDGTLADTVGDLAAALNRTLGENDLSPLTVAAVRAMVGDGLGKLLERGFAHHGVVLDPATREAVLGRLVGHYAAAPCAYSTLYPGVPETLVALREAGIACGVLTNKDEPIARNILKRLGISSAFQAVRGRGSGFPKKPDPAGLLDLVEALGATPDTALLVGDSVTDVKTARAAGLRGVIAVAYGYSVAPVSELGADWVINHLHELLEGLALHEQAQ